MSLEGSENLIPGVPIDIPSLTPIELKIKPTPLFLLIPDLTFLANSLNTLQLADGNGSANFYGKVKQLQVYDTALTDEQLLQLTGESGTDFYESYAEMASALTYTIQ